MATIVADSTAYADVAAAVTAAARGDTVEVPAGSSTWASTLTLDAGITLTSQTGADNTIFTSSGSALIHLAPDDTAIEDEEVIRIEGFTFDGGDVSLTGITGNTAGAGATKAFKNLAIGNNRFLNMVAVTSGSGAIYIIGQTRGVIYSNLFDRCNVIIKIMGNDNVLEWESGYFTQSYGTSDNLFFEDNTIEWSSSYLGGDPGWTETGHGGRLIIRYNTWDQANAASASEVWDVHGFQNWGTEGQTGTMVVEYYGNTLLNIGTYRTLNHRGGWGLFFNNIITGPEVGVLGINQYADGDTGGSGCTVDIPGATGNYIAEVANTYVWNNTGNGTIMDLTPGDPIGDGCGVSENNGYWNFNDAFTTGSNGIGRGTSAPVTSGHPDGAAFWVASTATPTVSSSVIQSGHLYKRVDNAWVNYYTPYTYPHPLRAGEPAPGDPAHIIAGVPVF